MWQVQSCRYRPTSSKGSKYMQCMEKHWCFRFQWSAVSVSMRIQSKDGQFEINALLDCIHKSSDAFYWALDSCCMCRIVNTTGKTANNCSALSLLSAICYASGMDCFTSNKFLLNSFGLYRIDPALKHILYTSQLFESCVFAFHCHIWKVLPHKNQCAVSNAYYVVKNILILRISHLILVLFSQLSIFWFWDISGHYLVPVPLLFCQTRIRILNWN